MAEYCVVEATEEHAAKLAPLLRESDRLECLALWGERSDEALRRSVRDARGKAWAGLVDGEAVAVFGVTEASVITRTGYPWFLASARVEEHRRALARFSLEWADRFKSIFPRLENFVSAENTAACRWLEWLGFTVEREVLLAAGEGEFHPFWWEKGR